MGPRWATFSISSPVEGATIHGVTTRHLHALLRDRLVAQANLFAALTSHPTLTGSARERALHALLREVLPRRYEVLDGTIVSTDKQGQPTKTDAQVDLMIVDTMEFPVLLREGDTAIVLPQAVLAVIEIKTDLAWTQSPSSNPFLKTLHQIGALRQATDPGGAIPVTLFSYTSPATCTTLRQWLEDTVKQRDRLRGESHRLHAANKATEALEIERKASQLDAALLPERIVCDTGVIALKVDDATQVVYRFYKNSLGSDAPSAVVFLVDDIVQSITTRTREQQDPAFNLFSLFLGAKILNNASDPPVDPLVVSTTPSIPSAGGPP